MSITVADIVPFSEARTQLSALVSEVQTGKEKIITKNGEGVAALIGAERLDHYHRLERAHIHLLLLHEIERGLADVEAGRHQDAREALKQIKQSRTKSASV
jgi:prevent-host-death family protein